MNEATWDFLEELTFSDADTIMSMIRETSPVPTVGLPVWARNLAYRLACLQRPDDAELLRAAAQDLYCHGPDWNEQAEELWRHADELDGSSPA